MTEWMLRAAEPSDLADVVALKAATMRADLERLGRWDDERSAARVAGAFAPDRTRVIQIDGRTAGSISLRRDGESVWLELFYVDPALQGRGIGAGVLRSILTEFDDRELRLDVLQGSRARGLYERHGFVFESEDEIDVILVRRPSPAVLGE
ncbi:GNAT family N-acetyltransferase [Agromyces seonyuensis]|uniref:GNAT family N-acetyltransferase n=1 Tax=Agromyces seonyuensis TaxID=2662446 RepID=A0A6I4P3K7_9MICO|nr:GNAT family N-acetyltransferase [Agromyces seonyuensis]MWB97814.1 GNAT family N-acetyltransferase [Agromyces seonyuensis]